LKRFSALSKDSPSRTFTPGIYGPPPFGTEFAGKNATIPAIKATYYWDMDTACQELKNQYLSADWPEMG
jgi:hypothetical protein